MICGTDEAGKGPVFGPLVIAAVGFTNEEEVNRLGVKDSKKLSPRRREQYARVIEKYASNIEILVISASDIDDMRKVMTMNEIEVYAFTKVIKKIKPDVCYVDAADVNEERFGKEIGKQLPKKTEIISKHKADDLFPVVSAASIIAKTRRDAEMQKIAGELEPKIGKSIGSGYPADPLTKSFLETWVKTYKKLPPHTRHSWKTAQNVLNKIKTKSLDDF